MNKRFSLILNSKNMSHFIKVGFFVVCFTFLFLATATQAAIGPAPTVVLNKSKTQIKINEEVTVSVLAGVFLGEKVVAPEKIDFYVDGTKSKVANCEDQHTCLIQYFWPTGSKGINKWHKITAKASYNGKTTTKETWVFVINKLQPGTQPSAPASGEVPEYEKIITSNNQPKVGDTFNAEIYPKDYFKLAKITVSLDGVLQKECYLSVTAQTCSVSVGPLTATQVGEHKYVFNLIGKNGNSVSPWGKFTVNEALTPAQDSLSWDKVITSSGSVLVGETFTATAYAKPNKTVYLMRAYVDGVLVQTCQNAFTCTLSYEAKQNSLGEHAYKFTFTSQEGNSLEVSGKFVVSEGKDLVAPNVLVSSDKEKLKVGESAVITATASDNKAVYNLQILVAGIVVKECAGEIACSYTIGPVNANPGLLKYMYSAKAYDAAGNNMWTGNNYIDVEVTQPVVEPMISITTSKASLSPNETVDFTTNVNPGSKTLTKLQILVNLQAVKECYTNSCVFTGGPYAGSSINYAATAFFSDGTYKSTGYNILSVVTVPTISIYPDKLKPNDKEMVTFTAKATTGGKTLKILQIVVNDKIVKECTTTMCPYTGGPFTEYSKSNITYAATACFVEDGTCITTWNKNLWIYSFIPNPT